MTLFDNAARNYDAILIVSFGGPEGPGDVMPFLDNVLAGLRVPPPVKERIAQRYHRFGGISPINRHTREFIAALERELAASGPRLPVYWGNRNWHPMLGDTLARMARDGIGRAIAYVTSTFSSYSGCRKYREDLYAAVDGLDGAPHIDKLRLGYNHPGFIAAMADRLRDAFARTTASRRQPATRKHPATQKQPALLFTAHSLPLSMAGACDYVAQLREACSLAAELAGAGRWELVYQSQNASYGEPWLGPDIGEALESVRAAGHAAVVVAPIGFVCDHMEVVLDLDVEAAERAVSLGLNMVRAGTVGTHPAYVRMVRDLIAERMTTNPDRPALGARGASHDYCPAGCCLSGRPGEPRGALCGAESTR